VRYQLRDYTVREGALDEFVREWRERIVPIRERFGFVVAGAWVVEGESRFVWVVGYDGPEGFEARDREYYDSPERAALDPSPARHIAEMRLAMMTAAPGS
jgi:hypothetical protein